MDIGPKHRQQFFSQDFLNSDLKQLRTFVLRSSMMAPHILLQILIKIQLYSLIFTQIGLYKFR